MPCVHAVAAISWVKIRHVEDFVSPFLTMDAIRKTYDTTVKPVNNEKYWEPTDAPRPIAPRIVRPAGRPRKKRTEAVPPPAPVDGDKSKKQKKGNLGNASEAASSNASNQAAAPELALEEQIAKARKQKKKMPKRPIVPPQPEEEIDVAQSAPSTLDQVRGHAAHPPTPPMLQIPNIPPLPKQHFRPKKRIFRPPAPFMQPTPTPPPAPRTTPPRSPEPTQPAQRNVEQNNHDAIS
ncbi:hypothetical protein PIB30_047895 [Stylosanthes scabra]|uniref:SWIM-type domain-containing protein n=1 Tax=Stylosanthes scabra TaxID=79078 RepID=A0ABU6QHM5_9FABA|nr:hypothetical protein [Stylosanthes scabra]